MAVTHEEYEELRQEFLAQNKKLQSLERTLHRIEISINLMKIARDESIAAITLLETIK